MAAPTVVLESPWTSAASFASARVGPCLVPVRLNVASSDPGDGLGWHKCHVEWTATPISGQGLSERYHVWRDPRRTAAGVTIRADGSGDPDRVRGWSYAMVLTPGSWRIRCTVINGSGESASADYVLDAGGDEPAIADNAYTVKYVNSATGTNTPGGGSIGSPYATLAYAISDVTTDVKIVLQDFHAEAMSGASTSGNDKNLWVVYEGSTTVTDIARPRITAPASASMFNLGSGAGGGRNIIFENFTLIPDSTDTRQCIEVRGQGMAFVHMHIEGDASGERFTTIIGTSRVGSNNGSQVAVINCSCPAFGSYFVSTSCDNDGEGGEYVEDITVLGCTIGASTSESGIRTTAETRGLTVNYCRLTGDGSKSLVRYTQGTDMWLHGCVGEDGDVLLGVSSPGPHTTVTRRLMVTGCHLSGDSSAGPLVNVADGPLGVRVSDNVIVPGPDVVAVGGDATPDNPTADVLIAHNTVDMRSSTSGSFAVRGLGYAPDDSVSTISGVEVRNNAVVLPADFASGSRAIAIHSAGLAADAVSGNVVTPDAVTTSNTNAYERNGTGMTLATFVAQSEVDATNQELPLTIIAAQFPVLMSPPRRARATWRDAFNRPRPALAAVGAQEPDVGQGRSRGRSRRRGAMGAMGAVGSSRGDA